MRYPDSTTYYQIPEEQIIQISTSDNCNTIQCPNCGATNTIVLNDYRSIQALKFCWQCGKEI